MRLENGGKSRGISVTRKPARIFKGKSTETAISKTVNTIEKTIDNKNHCIAVSLDMQAAFDTINPKCIREFLIKHGRDSDLIEWYYNYIIHRNLKKNRDRRTHGRGIN